LPENAEDEEWLHGRLVLGVVCDGVLSNKKKKTETRVVERRSLLGETGHTHSHTTQTRSRTDTDEDTHKYIRTQNEQRRNDRLLTVEVAVVAPKIVDDCACTLFMQDCCCVVGNG